MTPALLLDVDGTLVDSNYHLCLSWARAFRDVGLVIPLAAIHRHIGMGGDHLVTEIAGESMEADRGDEIRTRWHEHSTALLPDVQALAGAGHVVDRAAHLGASVYLCSSSPSDHLDHYRALLDLESLPYVGADDAERTKPDPDLLHAALEQSGRPAVMVGDSPWDCEAAGRAQVPVVAVLSGGFCPEQLTDSGAEHIYENLGALADDMADLLARAH